MSWLKYIRNKMGLSQSQLANVLGVSRSLVALTEKEIRELPTSAVMKLAEFELQIDNKIFPVQRFDNCVEQEEKQFQMMVKEARFKADKAYGRAEKLMYKLKKIKSAYDKSLVALKTNTLVADDRKKRPLSGKESSGLDVNESAAEKAYNQNNLARQAALMLEIELLDASARVYNEFIRNYSLAIGPPMQTDAYRGVLLLENVRAAG